MAIIQKTFQYGEHTVTLKAGEIARQADGAVMVSMGDTIVLVTVVGVKEVADQRDFFPLTVHYQERSYAAGKVPGGYFKREGRPSENEILISRLMDRPLRPLFPDDFTNEVQIIATLLSLDPEINADVPAMLGASAALAISGLPFNGPIGAARVGYKDGVFLVNPTATEVNQSKLDLVVAGTASAVLMVESEAEELPEEIMLSAVLFGHQQMQIAIQAIKEFASDVGRQAWDWQPPAHNQELENQIKEVIYSELTAAYQIQEKLDRRDQIAEVRTKVLTQFVGEEAGQTTEEEVKRLFEKLESNIVRGQILDTGKRIDGRDTKTIRPITIKTGLLPRTHGSVLFTHGYHQTIEEVVNDAVFDSDMSEMVIVKNIELYSLCEHHLLPFIGKCHVGYIPQGKVIGLSKIARIVDFYARRLQIQEKLTDQIAKCISHVINASGVGVIIEAQHLCMMMRGVEKQNSVMTTSMMLGALRTNASTRAEFLNLVRNK